VEINGNTQVLVHLAYPSAHLQTPRLFNARCRARAYNAILVPWQVQPAALPQVLNALRVSDSVIGMIVTIPHKETVAALCDQLEGAAKRLTVANVVRKTPEGMLIGRMLDGEGFVGGLRQEGYDPHSKSALLIGAGGVAVAIADALLTAGVMRLAIANRSQDRAQRLVERLTAQYPDRAITVGAADAHGFDLVVNATSLGMQTGDPLPLDITTLASGTLVADVVMAPAMTPLLQAARQHGATIHPGIHMLTGQIDAFIDFVLGGDTACQQIQTIHSPISERVAP